MNCSIFYDLKMRVSESPFEPNPLLSFSSKRCLRFAIFNFSENLLNIFAIGIKIYGVIVEKSLSEKKSFGITNSVTRFCRLYIKLATVQI